MDPNSSNSNASGNTNTNNNSNVNAALNSNANNNSNNKKQSSRNHHNKKSSQSVERRSTAELQLNKPWPRSSQRRDYAAGPSSSNPSSYLNAQRFKAPPQTSTYAKAGVQANAGSKRRRGLGSGPSSIAYAATNVDAAGAGLMPPEERSIVTKNSTPSNEHYELNSVHVHGSKKQSLNHLLNFHYAPRESDGDGGMGVFGRDTGHRAVRTVSKKHKYNKEQFLQANYQFVVKPSAKLKITASPDAFVDWELIEQINVQTTEKPQCPICLYPPIAAKLTRCGHVYCWPCILHYVALSETTWCRCPICHEAIYVTDLKSAAIVQQQPIQVGHQVTLLLMRRLKGTLYIEPHSNAVVAHSTPRFPQLSSRATEAKLFSKFLIANRVDVLQIIERERNELVAADDDASSPEFVYIQQALDLLKERCEKLGTKPPADKSIAGEKCKAENDADELVEAAQAAAEREAERATARDDDVTTNKANPCEKLEGVVCATEAAGTPSESMPSTPPSSHDKSASDYYYFYQSHDGQNVFLHVLNMKMIEANYGALNLAPLQFDARIVQKEFHSMDDQCRRRFACLSHLPLTCQFAVVELAMKPPLVSNEIVKLFETDLSLRKRGRRRRARDEDRREQLINEINDRQMGKLIASTISLNLNSSHEFPSWGFEESSLADDVFAANANAETTLPTMPSRYATSYSSVALEGGDTPNLFDMPKGRTHNTKAQKPSAWSAVTTSHGADSIWNSHSSLCTNLSDVLAEAMSQNKQQAKESKSNEKKATSGGVQNGGAATGAIKKTKKPKKMLPLFSTGINYKGN